MSICALHQFLLRGGVGAVELEGRSFTLSQVVERVANGTLALEGRDRALLVTLLGKKIDSTTKADPFFTKLNQELSGNDCIDLIKEVTGSKESGLYLDPQFSPYDELQTRLWGLFNEAVNTGSIDKAKKILPLLGKVTLTYIIRGKATFPPLIQSCPKMVDYFFSEFEEEAKKILGKEGATPREWADFLVGADFLKQDQNKIAIVTSPKAIQWVFDHYPKEEAEGYFFKNLLYFPLSHLKITDPIKEVVDFTWKYCPDRDLLVEAIKGLILGSRKMEPLAVMLASASKSEESLNWFFTTFQERAKELLGQVLSQQEWSNVLLGKDFSYFQNYRLFNMMNGFGTSQEALKWLDSTTSDKKLFDLFFSTGLNCFLLKSAISSPRKAAVDELFRICAKRQGWLKNLLMEDMKDRRALHFIADNQSPETIEGLISNIVTACQENGWPLSEFLKGDEDGKSPLHVAVEAENLPLVKALIALYEKNPIELKDDNRMTPFHRCLYHGKFNMARQLLSLSSESLKKQMLESSKIQNLLIEIYERSGDRSNVDLFLQVLEPVPEGVIKGLIEKYPQEQREELSKAIEFIKAERIYIAKNQVEAYLKCYSEFLKAHPQLLAKASLKETIMRLCFQYRHPIVHQKQADYWFVRINKFLENNSLDLIEGCLKAGSKEFFKFSEIETKAHFIPFEELPAIYKSAHDLGFPDDWIRSICERNDDLLKFFPKIHPIDPIPHLQNCQTFMDFYFSYGLEVSIDTKYYENKFPLSDCVPFAKNYIVNKTGFTKEFGYGSNQVRYGAFLHQSTLIAHDLMVKKTPFTKILNFLRFRRYQIAMMLNQAGNLSFGARHRGSSRMEVH